MVFRKKYKKIVLYKLRNFFIVKLVLFKVVLVKFLKYYDVNTQYKLWFINSVYLFLTYSNNDTRWSVRVIIRWLIKWLIIKWIRWDNN